ncbi:MAG: hypothetical protein WCK67_03455 [bacterium]
MHGSLDFKNPINLFTLNAEPWFQDTDFEPILKNDIWCNGTLILRSGNHLTKEIINKLLNFGINEVTICNDNEPAPKDELNALEELKINFLKTQNVILFDKQEANIKNLNRMLAFIGFKQRKIISLSDLKNFIKIINNFKPLYTFISYDLFINNGGKDILKKLILPDNCNIFIIYEGCPKDKKKIIDEVEGKNRNNNIKVLFKPILIGTLRSIISDYTQKHFDSLLKTSLPKVNTPIYKMFN